MRYVLVIKADWDEDARRVIKEHLGDKAAVTALDQGPIPGRYIVAVTMGMQWHEVYAFEGVLNHELVHEDWLVWWTKG